MGLPYRVTPPNPKPWRSAASPAQRALEDAEGEFWFALVALFVVPFGIDIIAWLLAMRMFRAAPGGLWWVLLLPIGGACAGIPGMVAGRRALKTTARVPSIDDPDEALALRRARRSARWAFGLGILASVVGLFGVFVALFSSWSSSDEGTARAAAARWTASAATPPTMAFETRSGPCYGSCISYVTRIERDGSVIHAMTGQPVHGGVVTCPSGPGKVVSAEDRAALAKLALTLPDQRASYPDWITDHARLTTVVMMSGSTYATEHPDEAPPLNPAVPHPEWKGLAEVIHLHEEIERLAGTEAWIASCTEEKGENPALPSARAKQPRPADSALRKLLDSH
jgi:hypothetical protein